MTKEEFVASILAKRAEKKLKKTEKKRNDYVEGVLGVIGKNIDCCRDFHPAIETVGDNYYGAEFDFSHLSVK